MASITNAVAHAIGYHIRETPLKPSRVLEALEELGIAYRP
jgi:CO/xanthine dehydrogenase Mo-binding subunit